MTDVTNKVGCNIMNIELFFSVCQSWRSALKSNQKHHIFFLAGITADPIRL